MTAALVVGGNSGIGLAVVERYRANGRDVLVWDLHGPVDIECDVSDPGQVDEAMRQTVDLIGVPTEVT